MNGSPRRVIGAPRALVLRRGVRGQFEASSAVKHFEGAPVVSGFAKMRHSIILILHPPIADRRVNFPKRVGIGTVFVEEEGRLGPEQVQVITAAEEPDVSRSAIHVLYLAIHGKVLDGNGNV